MRKFFIAAALAVAALVGHSSSADAAFSVRITTTAGTKTITDGGVGDLDGSADNSILFGYSDSAYKIIGSLAFTNSPDTSSLALLDAIYSFVAFNPATQTNTTGGLATLEVSATGFTQPIGNPVTLANLLNGNGAGGGTISSVGYLVNGGALFDTSAFQAGPVGPLNVAGGYFGSATASGIATNPYTLTEVITVNLNPGSSTTGDAQLTVTNPAPAGLVLALVGMPVFGIGAYIRRRRAVAA